MKTKLRIIIIYSLIAVIPIIFAVFFIYWNTQQTIIKNKLEELGTIADLKAEIISSFFNNAESGVIVAHNYFNIKTNLPIISHYINDQKNAKYVQAKNMLDGQLRTWLTLKGGVIDVELANTSGTVVYTLDAKHNYPEIGNPLPDPGNLSFSNGEKGTYISDIFVNKYHDNVFSFISSAPVYDFQNNFAGVVAIEFDVSGLYQLVENTSGLGQTGETLIGKLEHTPGATDDVLMLNPLRNDPNAAFKLKIPIGAPIGQPVQMAALGGSSSGIAIDYRGEETLSAWRYLPDRKWGLVAKIDLDEILGPVNALGVLLIALSLIIAAAAAMVIFLLSKKSYDQFKLAVDNSSEQIVITDPEGIVLYINQATEKITGYKINEIMNKKVGVLWNGSMPLEFYRNLWKTIKTDKKKFIGELKNRRKNGEVYDAEVKISPVMDKKNNIVFFVGIERDITSEKRVAQAKGEFVSLASHQLRTPPSIIAWYTETLQSGDLGPINDKQADYLSEIYKANQRMIAIINSLLNISRIEMGTFSISPKDINIKNIIDETIKELASRFNRKIEVKKDYDPTLESFKADPDIIQIIIDNLLSNSVKYSSPENTAIEITIRRKNGSLFLGIKDNGIGIPLKDQDRVFEKLFRADNAVTANPDGTGLGLYMTKKIVVDGLGGTIRFDSEENKGTTFYVSLPVSGMKEKSGATRLVRIP